VYKRDLLESIAINQTILSSQQNIAINITQDSVGDESFHIWLNDFLGRQTETCRFHFELREDTIL
jgi:hypothetical protein